MSELCTGSASALRCGFAPALRRAPAPGFAARLT